jgi:Cu+-exporting ATPase
MTVAVETARETALHDGVTYVFCGAHCRSRFETDPARYLIVA